MPLFVRISLSYTLGVPYGNQTSKTNMDAYFPSVNSLPEVLDKIGISTSLAAAIGVAQYPLVRYDKATWHVLPEVLPTPGSRQPYDPDNGVSVPLAVTGTRGTTPTTGLADPRYCVWVSKGGISGLPGRLAIRGALSEGQVEAQGDDEILSDGALGEFGTIVSGIQAGFTLVEENSPTPFQLGIATYPQTGITFPAVPAGTEQKPVRQYGPRQFRPAPILSLNRTVLVLPLNHN